MTIKYLDLLWGRFEQVFHLLSDSIFSYPIGEGSEGKHREGKSDFGAALGLWVSVSTQTVHPVFQFKV